MSDKELKILSSELEHYEAEERTGHYLKAFDGDQQNHDLTLLIRDDVWEQHSGRDVLKYHTAAVAISQEDAVAFAKWVLERFDPEPSTRPTPDKRDYSYEEYSRAK
jgi:hypothetical protein